MAINSKINSGLNHKPNGVNKPAINRTSGSGSDPIPSSSEIENSQKEANEERKSSDIGERALAAYNDAQKFGTDNQYAFNSIFNNRSFFGGALGAGLNPFALGGIGGSKNNPWANIAAISPDGEGATGKGDFSYGGTANVADKMNFDPNLIPNYEDNKKLLMSSIKVYDVGNVTMGQEMSRGVEITGIKKERVIDDFLINFGANQKHIDLIASRGVDVFIADGIQGTAADGRSRVGAYYQSGGERGTLVFRNNYDAITFSHETGHMMDHFIDGRMDGKIPVSGYDEAMNEALAKVKGNLLHNNPGFSRLGYGLSNDQEFLAVMIENYKNENTLFEQHFPKLNKVFDDFFGNMDQIIRQGAKPDQTSNSTNGNRSTSQVSEENQSIPKAKKEEFLTSSRENSNTELVKELFTKSEKELEKDKNKVWEDAGALA